MRKLGLTLFVIEFVLVLPLMAPIGLCFYAISRHRLRSTAKNFRCVGCGEILGSDGLALADKEWRKNMEELRAKFPGVKFRVVRPYDAICVRCKKQYKFDEKHRAFLETSPSGALMQTAPNFT